MYMIVSVLEESLHSLTDMLLMPKDTMLTLFYVFRVPESIWISDWAVLNFKLSSTMLVYS